MTYDLLVRNGRVVDGTGAVPRLADVAVKDGRIALVGKADGGAARVIDAEGALVTPGFVDMHTHYDGQVSWDDEMAPSIGHGVTTCVMGNCGVGFAPVRTPDHDRLIDLMQGVEDIPGSALSEGIRWGWQTFAEYMDVLDSAPHAIDFAAQVPHDALRVYAMGERASARGRATEDDLRVMQSELRAALQAGAVGFSTGRTDNHRAMDGTETPSAEASTEELCALGRAFEGLGHGVLQAVSDFDMMVSPDRFDAEFDILVAMARAANRPMSISLMQRGAASDQWRKILARVEKEDAAGHPTRVQVAPRGIGVLLGLEATFHPFMGFPTYKAIAHLPLAERVAEMRKPEVKAKMLTESSEKVAGDGSPIPPMADEFLANLDFVAMSLFQLGASPSYEQDRKDSLYGQAMARGVPALDVVYDAMLADEGRELLYFPVYNYLSGTLNEVSEMLHHPLSLPGLSDGGAHVGTICDASFPTFLLTHWTRDRAEGRFTIEAAIKRLTGDSAAWMGFSDRGTIAVGKKADLNVIDHDKLTLRKPHIVRDLPLQGRRFMQHADGYRATIVSGQIVRENGKTTDARPGRLVRGGS